METLWLVRRAKDSVHFILGPFSLDHIRKMIQAGELGLEDEVCAGGGYWFSLYEKEEVSRNLGIEMPRAQAKKEGEEVTETQTETETDFNAERTDPDLRSSAVALTPPRPIEIRGVVEKPSLLRALTWLLILAACFLFFSVLRLLRS